MLFPLLPFSSFLPMRHQPFHTYLVDKQQRVVKFATTIVISTIARLVGCCVLFLHFLNHNSQNDGRLTHSLRQWRLHHSSSAFCAILYTLFWHQIDMELIVVLVGRALVVCIYIYFQMLSQKQANDCLQFGAISGFMISCGLCLARGILGNKR